MTATRLADGVWGLDLGLVNAYLVDNGSVTLVDAGTPGAVETLRAGLTETGHEPGGVDRVLVTHYDLDHVGGLADLALDCPVYMMEPDASHLEGRRKPPLRNRKGLLQRATRLLLTAPDTPVERVADGETVDGFSAYHTPGHTPGHAVYYHADLGVALLGDLVTGDDGDLGTVPWPLAYDDGRVRRSIRALADRALDFEVACVGHGDPLSEGGGAALRRLADR